MQQIVFDASAPEGDLGHASCGTTVVLSTRNRAAALDTVLETFTRLIAPADGWKLVIVDNGSTDGTRAVLDSYASRLPLTVLLEPRPGKNRALNCALPHLQGSLLVFTDDDVLPRPDWLVSFRQAACDHPEASFFGGTIVPHWSRRRPAWLTETAVPFDVLYSQQTRASGFCSYDSVFGPNMAVRGSVIAEGFRFSETVGPNETAHLYPMGSETELLRRIEQAGHRGWFASGAVVEHIIRPEQLEEVWILQRGYRYGFGEGYNYIVRNRGLGGALSWLPPRPRLNLRTLIFRAAAWLIRPLPRNALRLTLLYKACTIKGANDRARRRGA